MKKTELNQMDVETRTIIKQYSECNYEQSSGWIAVGARTIIPKTSNSLLHRAAEPQLRYAWKWGFGLQTWNAVRSIYYGIPADNDACWTALSSGFQELTNHFRSNLTVDELLKSDFFGCWSISVVSRSDSYLDELAKEVSNPTGNLSDFRLYGRMSHSDVVQCLRSCRRVEIKLITPGISRLLSTSSRELPVDLNRELLPGN